MSEVVLGEVSQGRVKRSKDRVHLIDAKQGNEGMWD